MIKQTLEVNAKCLESALLTLVSIMNSLVIRSVWVLLSKVSVLVSLVSLIALSLDLFKID